MPELPEVETMRRGIAAIVGSRIAGAEVIRNQCKPLLISPRGAALNKRLAGATVSAVGRLGKRVVIELKSGDALVIEPRMTGLVLLASPPTAEHLRFRLKLSGGPVREVLYWDRRGLGSVRLLSPPQLSAQLGPGKLGPDALAVSPAELRERLVRSRRAIKVALLDQRAVAGIGNLYAAEILHLASIHPERPCSSLRLPHWAALHRSMLEVLQAAIQYEGSTLGDGTYRNALNEQGQYQNHHRVYGRAGEPCGRCQGKIARIVQAQRSTFYCPRCQRRRG